MRICWIVIVLAWVVGSFVPCASAENEETRIVVSVGSNQGLAGEEPLEYAEEDARRFRDLALELGGVAADRGYLLTATTAQEVLRTLAVVRGRVEELSKHGPTALFLYVSAHGDRDSVHLSGTRLGLTELRQSLAGIPTRFRLIVVDACQTPAQARDKGGAAGPDVPVVVQGQTDAAGEVFIASASPGEPAQEWTYLRGALFTHHWLAALRGAADFDSDGEISLTEAYSYAYRHTVADAALSAQAPQRPSFDFQFQGFGDFGITHPGRSAAIELDAELRGRFLIIDAEQKLVVELVKNEGAPIRIGLRPGWYRVVHPERRTVLARDVNLAWGGVRSLGRAGFVEVPNWQSRLRGPEPIVLRPYRLRVGYGISGPSVSGLGVQHWLDIEQAYLARRGFVAVALAGNMDGFSTDELRVRHHELRVHVSGGARVAWGIWALALGAEGQLAWALQRVDRQHGEEIEAVFGLHEPTRTAAWFGVAGLLGIELALSERWFMALQSSVGAQRIFGGNQSATSLGVRANASLGWSF